MKCERCGKELADIDLYCQRCGKAVFPEYMDEDDIWAFYKSDEELIEILKEEEMCIRDRCYTGLKNLTIPEHSCVLLECMSNLTANEMFQETGAGEQMCIRDSLKRDKTTPGKSPKNWTAVTYWCGL